MQNVALVQVQVDTDVKENVSEIYENLGIDLQTAIKIFLKKSIAVRGLPFELREESPKANRWSIYENARKIMQENNVPEMTLEEINKEISAARKQAC